MNITVNKQSALAILRALRAQGAEGCRFGRRIDLATPSPAPSRRWTRKRLAALAGISCTAAHPLDVAVPSADVRLQTQCASNTVYASGLPKGSFVDVGGGLAISCPELLFVELANSMDVAQHVALGNELCARFTRNAADPVNGQAVMGLPPATSKARIERFLRSAHGIAGTTRARKALAYVSDNAWSPAESTIALVASLPAGLFGYDLGPVTLNQRIETPEELSRTTDRASRVPDIMFDGTPVGINYDGAEHLDLGSIVAAARKLERNPEEALSEHDLYHAMRNVRAKAVDDLRRNRELAADGLTVFSVVKEDLYDAGGLDRVMGQVIVAIERSNTRDVSKQRRLLESSFIRSCRYRMLRELVPASSRPFPPPPSQARQSSTVHAVVGGL